MCGLTGSWEWGAPRDRRRAAAIADMTASLRHRGPDDDGVFVDEGAGLAFGFRRLSIIDLSPAGHQPMTSASGRFVITYNGEIYNHRELRAELDDVAWQGASDTEVLLEACARWGVDRTVRRLIGMFAIAVWDREERQLTLVRDRLGIKPLYYAASVDGVAWGSELKALRAGTGFDAPIDDDALQLYFRLGYVPAPHTIYRGVRKLEPGCHVTFRAGAAPQVVRYWSAAEAARAGAADPLALGDREAVEALDSLLGDAVSRRMIADVPLGAFLSGGVDSSSVVALMQAHSSRPVRTFSIGFAEDEYNEAPFAREVARHLGTEHTELYVSPGEARSVIPMLPDIYDEPFADSSQIPTFLVSRLARRDVAVALSGDGGDEVFGGYNRHVWLERLWRRVSSIPLPARRVAAAAIGAVPGGVWDTAYRAASPLIGGGSRIALPADKIRKFARVLGAADPDAAYLQLVSQWPDPRALLTGSRAQVLPAYQRDPALGTTEAVMLLDQLTYLAEDILAKVDRASMAVSLEVRVPLIDHRVVEWAWRLPRHMRHRDGTSKWLLRQVLYRHVPPSLIERPKFGFGVPVGRWLREDLREWAEALLAPQALAAAGCLNVPMIRRTWEEHRDGRRDWQHRLWTVLMFQAWRERWGARA